MSSQYCPKCIRIDVPEMFFGRCSDEDCFNYKGAAAFQEAKIEPPGFGDTLEDSDFSYPRQGTFPMTFCKICQQPLMLGECQNKNCIECHYPRKVVQQGTKGTIFKKELRGPLTKYSKTLDDCEATLRLVEGNHVKLSKEKTVQLRGEIMVLKRLEQREIDKAIQELIG